MISSELHIDKNESRLFRRLAFLTVIVVYLLILVGGIVRSTGAGMGCPDWPKCFGSWIPPTEESQLPLNYKEIYGNQLKGEVEFNVTKTWIEYLNRLLGAFTGVLIFATLLASTRFLRKDRPVFYMSLLAFVLVGFQGWLGSKVVSSELHPFMVTIHMLVAIIIVFVLLYTLARSFVGQIQLEEINKKQLVNNWFWWTISISLLQVILGTQVRESLDEIINNIGYSARDQWVGLFDYRFYIHRSFSLIVLAFHLGLIYHLRKNVHTVGFLYNLTSALVAIVLIEIGTGVILAYFNIPSFAQPIHLTLAVVAIGVQFMGLLLLNAEHIFKRSIISNL